jgi:PTH1 family peptidyl-tRNA hydrolase
MLLLIGLGNPGPRYAGNRHNIGFMAVDEIHRAHRGQPWRSRFHAECAEVTLQGRKALLMKPQTFMNESGLAARAAMDFYKLSLDQLYVFHDELDLPPAKIRVKKGGGNAGHNGLRSISAHCGNDYTRIRLGIGHPGDKALVHAYVLNDFAKAEGVWVTDFCAAIAAEAPALGEDDNRFASRIHLAMNQRGHAEVAVIGREKKAGQGEEPR